MTEHVLMRRGAGPARAVPAAEAAVPIHDRGFLYGDGLFETIRVVEGRTPLLVAHLRRLAAGARLLAFPPLPWSDSEIAADCEELVRRNGVTRGWLRLTLTRGSGSRGFEPPSQAEPVLILQARSWDPDPDLARRGYRAVLAGVRVSAQSPLCRVKSLSALEKVLARAEARQQGCEEALLLNTDGYLTEGAATNLFLVRDGQILTPHPDCGLLPGIARELVMAAARELGYPVVESRLVPQDLWTADEAFLTNALLLVVPLVAVAGRPVGRGQGPGPVTRALQERCQQLLERGA